MLSAIFLLSTATGFCCGVLTGYYAYPLMNIENENIGNLDISDYLTNMVMETKNPEMKEQSTQTEQTKMGFMDYFMVN